MALETQSTKEFEAKLDEALKNISPTGDSGEPPATAGETPPVTPPTPEVPKAEIPKPKVEPPKEEVPKAGESTQPPTGTPETVFDVKVLNERFGTQFENEETLKSSLNRLNDLQEFDTVKAQKEEFESKLADIQQKYEEAKELLDPRKHFVSEEEYKRQMILQQHGRELNSSLLNKVISADFSQMSDIDVLVLGKQIANPNIIGGEAGAREMIYQTLGVDPDESPSEWSQLTKNIVAEAALNARKELEKIKNVDVPEKVDFDAQRAEKVRQTEEQKTKLQDAWTKIASEMVKGFNSFSLTRDGEGGKKTYFSFDVDPQFKADAAELVTGYLVDSGLEPTKENVQEAQRYVEDLFWRKNGNAIVQAYGKDVEAKLIEKYNIEQDNPKPPNDTEAPDTESDKQNADLINYIKEGLRTERISGDKLFG